MKFKKSSFKKLNSLSFNNRFVEELPCDPEKKNFIRQVKGACYSLVEPSPVKAPQLVAFSKEVAELLDLSTETCQSEEFTKVFVGNQLLEGMKPFSMCYAGHQFGNFAGQLGDGRAINLGEVLNESGNHLTLQLKGAGLTPYSRRADGLAVLRSSIREFLCSEAMHFLGVPTTRALSLILTGEKVTRDMFYDGNPKEENGAVVCRVSPSFIRFGSFQMLAIQQDQELLQNFVDFTIRNDFPHLPKPSEETYGVWFKEVCTRTADMIIQWERVGFVHGVMNTDNMSILGLTIDYGPYGWLDNYDPNWTPNTTDAQGRRYRFSEQADIGLWNLFQLAQSIQTLFKSATVLEEGLDHYKSYYEKQWKKMMAEKLGFLSFDQNMDEDLFDELFVILQIVETDMTIFFRRLSDFNVLSSEALQMDKGQYCDHFKDAYYNQDQINEEYQVRLSDWMKNYISRSQRNDSTFEERKERMDKVNPLYVLRNYLSQEAIDRADEGDFSRVEELLEILKNPYTEQKGKEHFAEKRPEWARSKAGCSMLSCSS